MKVQETVHHGDYRNVRVIDLPDTRPSTILRMMRDCPYPVSDESVWAHLREGLETGGRFQHGWVTWEEVRAPRWSKEDQPLPLDELAS